MKKLIPALSSLALLFLSSCVFSLFPIYTKDTLINISAFEGEWVNKSGSSIKVVKLGVISKMSVKVQPGDDDYIVQDGDTIRDKEAVAAYYENDLEEEITEILGKKLTGYSRTMIEGEDSIKYRAHLAKIGNNTFLDLYPADEGSAFTKALDGNFIPVHSFMKIQIDQDQLQLISFDLEKLQKLFKSNKIRLRHEEVDDLTVITAQPEEIQKFLNIYADRKDVLESPEIYQRTAP